MTHKLDWKLRRIAAGYRQQDIAHRLGLTVARYGAIERGEIEPNDAEHRAIENALPPLPVIESKPNGERAIAELSSA